MDWLSTRRWWALRRFNYLDMVGYVLATRLWDAHIWLSITVLVLTVIASAVLEGLL